MKPHTLLMCSFYETHTHTHKHTHTHTHARTHARTHTHTHTHERSRRLLSLTLKIKCTYIIIGRARVKVHLTLCLGIHLLDVTLTDVRLWPHKIACLRSRLETRYLDEVVDAWQKWRCQTGGPWSVVASLTRLGHIPRTGLAPLQNQAAAVRSSWRLHNQYPCEYSKSTIYT